MSRTTLISALLGIAFTLSLGYQVLAAGQNVAKRMQERQTVETVNFGE